MGTKSASEPVDTHKDDIPQLLPSLCNESKATTADETWEEREATLNTEANKPKTAPKLISRLKSRIVMNSENNTVDIPTMVQKQSKCTLTFNYQWFVEIPLVCTFISYSEGRHLFSLMPSLRYNNAKL